VRRWFLLLLVLLLLVGCSKFKPPPVTPVYLIVIDTLRTDSLGVYGGKRPTPFLDEFAKQAVVFDNCLSTSSWTVPSVASLFTGMYPFHHGTVKAVQDQGKVLSQQELSAGNQTMAEVFKDAGYRTYGVSANGHIVKRYGFAQGFDEYDEYNFLAKEVVAGSWAGMLPRVTGEVRFGQPTFVMLFYFDPHHPYIPQDPYIDQYYPGWEKHERADEMYSIGFTEMHKKGEFDKEPELYNIIRALYDSEVAGMDVHLAQVIPQLPRVDDAIVVIVSDHGESFGEQGKILHGNNLHQQETHVPLIIKLPHNRLAGTRIAAPVSLVDVLPTLAALVKAKTSPRVDGVSLLPLLAGRELKDRPIFLHLDMPWAQHRGMVRWPHKIIVRADQSNSVFDLSADPLEERDLAGSQDAQQLDTWLKEIAEKTENDVHFPPRVLTDEMTTDMRDKLRGLGYLN